MQPETITVNVHVDVTPASLQFLVENAKRMTGPDAKGHFKVDTADMLAAMISRFLLEKDFESYVTDIDNYPSISASVE